MNLWNPSFVVDNGWVNGYDVNYNESNNDVLTIIDLIWRWKHNELMILMWQLLYEILNLWKWNNWNGYDMNVLIYIETGKIMYYILLIVICCFVTEMMNLWNPNLVVDNGWVNCSWC